MKKYYLHNGTEQQGPFDTEELRLKNIHKDTPIWYEGLNEWTMAEKVDELKELFKVNTPPPFNQPKPEIAPPIVKPSVQTTIGSTQTPAKKSSTGLIITIIIIVGLIGVGLIYIATANPKGIGGQPSGVSAETYQDKVMTVEEIERADPAKFLDAGGTYNENFWGTAMKIHGEVTNNATVANYKDVVIEVVFYSGTDTELDRRQYTIYDVFNAHTTKKFEIKVESPKAARKCGWSAIAAVAL